MKSLQYITNQIRYMCTAFKDRSGGSAAEWQCQSHMRDELSRYADTVTEQEITVHPDAGWGWIVVVAACGIASIILPLLNTQSTALAAIAFLACVLGVIITVVHFLMGYHLLDRFFPARKAKNVFASAKPTGQVRQRIVFTGHADAAYEFTYSHLGGAKRIMRVAVTSFASLGLMLLLSGGLLIRQMVAGGIAAGSALFWLRVGALLLIPFFVEAMFFFNINCIVDGANDNLSGCAVSMAALKALSRPGNRLKNTEVCCLITSSEECGLRGAHAFATQYAAENDGVDTMFIALDTLHDAEQLMVYTQGMNGFQRNSHEAAEAVRQAGKSLGLTLKEAGGYLGATDAEAFSRAGLKACAVCGVDHTPQPYYHTRADTAQSIDEACIKASFSLCVQLARQVDRKASADAAALAEAI